MTSVGNIAPPIGNVGETTGFSEGQPASSLNSSSDDHDMFLKLLVAQMKYQDPTKPTDSSQLLSQSAQFSLVEKMDQLTEAYSSELQTSQLQSATAMLGNTITFTSDDATKSGIVTGVTIAGGVPTLMVGDQKVALADVTKVTKTATSTSTTTT